MAHVQNRFGIELPFTPTTRVIPERTAQGTEAPPSARNARPVVNVDASYAGNVYDCAVSTLQHGRNLCMHTEKHSAEIGCRNTSKSSTAISMNAPWPEMPALLTA
jgi:hypothetical protein